ncbi:MAG: SDR family NAD(P)-dependent oxidoreductase [Bacteroidota bacterium]
MTKKKSQNPVTATLAGIRDVFRKQQRIGALEDSLSMDGKTCLVTGANSGLGFAVATQLASRGAQVIMACRSGIPGAGNAIKKLTGSSLVEMLEVDLSDLASIEKLLVMIESKKLKFDVVICNAAVVPAMSRETPQGLEQMFMVNYLSKHILVNGLLNKQLLNHESDTPPRIIFVSSESHRSGRDINFDNFGKYEPFTMKAAVARYGDYKLMLTTFAMALHERLSQREDQPVHVHALCPGAVNTNIAREAPAWSKPLLRLVFSLFFNSPEKSKGPWPRPVHR